MHVRWINKVYCFVLVSFITYVRITELELQCFFFFWVGGGEEGCVNKQS